MLRRGGGAFQADVRVGVHAALVLDLVDRGRKRLLPGQGEAGFTVPFGIRRGGVSKMAAVRIFSLQLCFM